MARKMKDSGIEWIGEIPEGWEIRKIKNNFMIYAGATPKSEKAEYWDGGIPWITPADFKTTDKYVSYGRKSLTALGYDSCGTTLVPAGSIIFSKRAPVGSVVIAKNTLCTNQGCLACIPNDAVNSTYFYYCMSIFTEQFELVSAGTTFKEIAASTFASFLLPCPPLSQQNEIVNFLNKESSRIDSMLSKTRSSIEEYKKLKQAVITQAVTKGVRGEREMKPTDFTRWSEIPFDWNLKRVKSCIASISSGLSAVTDDANSEESGKFVLRTSAVSSGFFVPTEVKPVLKSAVNRLICPVEPDTLIVSRMNTASMVGACAYVANNHPNTFLPDKLWKIKFLPSYHTKYMWYALNSVPAKSWFSELATGASSSMQNISINDFTSNYLPIPAFSEQEEIADYLDAKCAEIDKLIAKKEQLVKELESYKKSLIYEVVTGKREV